MVEMGNERKPVLINEVIFRWNKSQGSSPWLFSFWLRGRSLNLFSFFNAHPISQEIKNQARNDGEQKDNDDHLTISPYIQLIKL